MPGANRAQISSSFIQPYRPFSIKLLNALGELGRSIGLSTAIDATALVERARRKTGLSDFDGDDAIDALNVLVDSINAEAHLTPIGQAIQRRRLLSALITRLQIREYLQANEEIVERPLNKVLIIAGLQRTGTTLLQRLIASHPRFRGIIAAEAFDPVAAVTNDRKSVRAANRRAGMYEKALSFLAPDFKLVHPVSVSAPEEDVLLLDLSFMSQAPEAMMRVPSYSKWLETQDHGVAYAHFCQVLQLLQFAQPEKNWVLKSPHHMEYLDAVLEQFPKATIIQTHRDPRKTMPSFCSMVAHGMGIFSDRVAVRELTAHWIRKVKRMMQKSIDIRERQPSRFFDISYYDLMSRPLDVLSELWDYVGVDFNDSARKAARLCLSENPKDRFGKHRYQLSDFGLDSVSIEREFGFYREKYNIPIEK